jgi:acetylornithine deacetylase
VSDAGPLLAQLVAFRSVAGRPNGEIAAFVHDWLTSRGVESRRIVGQGGRVGVLASTGPAGAGGVLLAAHMDVVETAGQDWSGDPFTLRERDGRLVGRGAADMKGFLGCAMQGLAAAAGRELRAPLLLAVSTDEEIGCLGVHDLIAPLRSLTAPPKACIVGEPTGMLVAGAHKGKLALRATLRGTARHSSEAPLAENAVEHAAELVLALRDRGRELADAGRRDGRFAIPHSTVSVGPIHGGTALNIVPDRCTVELEVRTIPGDDVEGLLPDTGTAELERLAAYPALDGDGLAAAQLLGVERGPAIDFGTEAGIYAELGIDTAVCGPGRIGDAHRADESVEIEQLQLCEAALGRLTEALM